MKQISQIIFALFILQSSFAEAATIADIINRFEGEYTGVVPGSEVGRPEDGSLIMHSFVGRVDLPAFGNDVIYLEQRYGGPEGSITRQRIMAFSQDDQGIVTRAYDFLEGAKYVRADAVPARVASLSPDAMYNFPEGCRIRWTEDGDGFVGEVNRQGCEIVSRSGRGNVFVDMVYRLTGDSYSLFEQGFDASDRFLFGTNAPHRHQHLPKRDLDEELEQILSAFEGGFENLPHDPAVTAHSNIIGNLYTHVRRVNLPAFGTHVQYIEFTRGGPDGAVVRQRLNVFDSNPNRRANVMVSYEFQDGSAYAGAYADPAKLNGLKPQDLEPLVTGCELIWSTVRGVLTGVSDRTICHRFNERLQVWRHVSFVFLLDGESMHLWEHSYSPEGNLIFGSPLPIRFPRVRSGWLGNERKASQ
ncbi:MAG: CpcT/CpeT family chromophore lyase [Rhodospirillaceae bacterium]|nr:CpcT/CpeT family chromophore lyase [Rhodospirillaceae bacterium]